MAQDAKAKNPLVLDDLYAAFEAADNIILKKYVADLSDAPCIEMSKESKTLEIGSNVALYRVAKVVYDKNENVRDKLTTIYSTIFSLKNCGLVMLINGHKEHADVFLGVVNRNLKEHLEKDNTFKYFAVDDSELTDSGKVLENSFLGNFIKKTFLLR